MRIGTILTATDLNPLYADFIPLFVRAWKTLLPEADIQIVLVAPEIPENLLEYAPHIRLFPPVPGIHTAFQAQCIRLLAPRDVVRDEGVLITDMDMLPMCRRYYVDSVASLPDDMFVVYREVCLPYEIAMCYNAAAPATWRAMFGDRSTETLLREWYSTVHYDGLHGGNGWNTDQVILVRAFNSYTGPKCILRDADTGFTRLDRVAFPRPDESLARNIREGRYCDYHALRPNSQYRGMNEWVVGFLPSTL